MRVAVGNTPPPQSADIEVRTARVAERWPGVHVESASIDRDSCGHCARAVVQLGGLAPADVRVELLSVGAARADAASPAAHRMFSSHGHDNGCFVFDAPLRSHEVTRREWLVRVHPSDAVGALRVEYRFRSPASRRRRSSPPP